MSTPAKFLFDRSFDQPGEARARPRTPTYSAADLENAVQGAYARGRADGAAEARAEVERELLTAVRRLDAELSRFGGDYEARIGQIRSDATEMAFAIARRLAGPLVERFGAERIRLMLAQCLAELQNEPRIVLRAADTVIEHLQPLLERTAASAGYQGHIVLLPDDTMASSDCRIEWADGGAAIDQARLEAQINEILRTATKTPQDRQ